MFVYQSTIVCDVSQVGYQLSALRACIGWQGGRRRRGTEIFKNETQKRRDTPQRPNGVSSLATAVARACDRPARFYALRSTPTASRYHPTSDISRSTQHRTALQLSTSPLLLHTAQWHPLTPLLATAYLAFGPPPDISAHSGANSSNSSTPSPFESNAATRLSTSASLIAAPPPGRMSTALSSSTER